MFRSTKQDNRKIVMPDTFLVQQNKKVVLVGGCFDILHYGHICFLEQAKKYGDSLVILLESDEFIEKYKQRKPFHNQDERAFILSKLEMIDSIIKIPLLKQFNEYTSIISKIHPSIIAVTEGDTKIDLKREQAKLLGAKVEVVLPQLLSFSSSNILSYASILRD